MEKLPKQEPEESGKNEPNFYEISKKRKELRKAAGELGGEGVIFEKHYKQPLAEAQEQATGFKFKASAGGLKGAKEILKKQKLEYEQESLASQAPLDYEAIFQAAPEVGEVHKTIEDIAGLKDFRVRRMFEILNPRISISAKERNERVLETVKEEIKAEEAKLAKSDSLVLRQAEFVEYKENLAQSGHICITPNVEKDMEAIGDRMLTGKPMFLHALNYETQKLFFSRRIKNQPTPIGFCIKNQIVTNFVAPTATQSQTKARRADNLPDTHSPIEALKSLSHETV